MNDMTTQLVDALRNWIGLYERGVIPSSIGLAQCVEISEAAVASATKSTTNKPRQPTAWDDREVMVRALNDSGALRSPAELVEAVDLPIDLAVVMTTGRTSMISMAKPRALDAGETAGIYKFIAVLIDTNLALQAHARQAAIMAEAVEQQVRGLQGYSRRLHAFANFTPADDASEPE